MDRPSLGEQVLFCKLIRDNILQHFNPWKLSDLRYVLELRCFKGLLEVDDLRNCFRRVWFTGGHNGSTDQPCSGFLLEAWSAMSTEEIKAVVEHAVNRQRSVGLPHTTIGSPLDFETMTKEELKRFYGALRYIPTPVFLNAVRGARVRRQLAGGGLGVPVRVSFKGWTHSYLLGAVESGMDVEDVRRILEEEFGEVDDIRARLLVRAAARHGHHQLVQYLSNLI